MRLAFTVCHDIRGQIEPQHPVFAVTRFGLLLLILGRAAAGYADTESGKHMSIGLDMLREPRFR
jgi:hypothetical protein